MHNIGTRRYFKEEDGTGEALGKALSLLENEKRLLESINEKLMNRYNEQNPVMGRSEEKLAKKTLLLVLLRC